MSKAMVNLTCSVVDQEIETALQNCTDTACQLHFSHPHWRQKLVAYVLRRIPGTYAVIEDVELHTPPSKTVERTAIERSTPEMAQIIQLVWQGMQHLSKDAEIKELERSPQLHLTPSSPPVTEPTAAPSTWFG